ncbi:MAG: DUF2846 domain-containing protein [Desulfobacterales bacterium]
MIKKWLAIVLMLTIPAGASALPEMSNSENLSDYELPAKPDKGCAMVYIVRPSEVDLFSRFYVYLDEKRGANRIGFTTGREHLYFQVTPGEHRIITQGEYNSKSIEFEVAGGDTLFIRQNVKLDVDKTNVDNMEILNPAEGTYAVSITTRGILDKHPAGSVPGTCP